MKTLGLSMLVAASFASSAAEQLELNLSLYLNNQLLKTQIINSPIGQQQTIIAKDTIKFEVTPSLQDNIVTINSALYRYESGTFTKFQEPSLMMPLNQSASIEIGTQPAAVYKIKISANELLPVL